MLANKAYFLYSKIKFLIVSKININLSLFSSNKVILNHSNVELNQLNGTEQIQVFPNK
jgi:hypothetical protein